MREQQDDKEDEQKRLYEGQNSVVPVGQVNGDKIPTPTTGDETEPLPSEFTELVRSYIPIKYVRC